MLTIYPDTVLRTCAAAEVKAFVERWLAVYGTNALGVNPRAFLWHVFSADRYPSVSGHEARAQYATAMAPEYVVLDNNRKDAVVSAEKPTGCTTQDYYVFPLNLAWTFAMTHEEGWYGPYFAKSPAYATLNGQNLAAIKKRREVEAARNKGWA